MDMYKIALRMVDIPPRGCHILCNLQIADGSRTFIIDTGASLTVMDKKRFEFLFPHLPVKPYGDFFTGIEQTNSMDIYTAELEKVSLGGLVLNAVGVLLINMDNINSAYARYDFERVEGILGGDILKRLKARIDYGVLAMYITKE